MARFFNSDIVVAFRRVFAGRGRDALLMSLLFFVKYLPVWVMPVMVARMIDLAALDTPDKFMRLWAYAGILMAVVAQNVFSHTAFVKRMSRISRGVGMDLRSRLTRQLQHMTLLYHDKTSVGKLQSKAIRDIEAVEALPRVFADNILVFFINVIVTIVAILVRAPLVIFFFLLCVPIAVMLQVHYRNKITHAVGEFRRSFENMSERMNDMISMIPLTRAHGLEEFEQLKMEDRIRSVFGRAQAFDVTNAWFGATSWVSFTLMNVIVLTGLVYGRFQNWLTTGDVVLFSALFGSITGSLNMMLNLLPEIIRIRESQRSIDEVLNSPDYEKNHGKAEVEHVRGEFDFREVSYSYPGTTRQAVADVNLTVKDGEVIAFVGPSGSGKSTMLSLLLGFVRPQKGALLLDGRDMESLDLRTYRQHVGVVTQSIVFFSGTLKENVAYGRPGISDDVVVEALKRANAWDFVQELPNGIYENMGADGIKLSGGQQQRLAIARALVRQPKVLIMDEATSALDVESEELVREALAQVMQGRTSFLVSHRLSLVRNADMIAVMEGGRITDIGTPSDLAKYDNFYSRMLEKTERST